MKKQRQHNDIITLFPYLFRYWFGIDYTLPTCPIIQLDSIVPIVIIETISYLRIVFGLKST